MQPTGMDDLTAANLLLELGNVNIYHVCVEEANPTSTVTTECPVTPVLATSSDKETQATSHSELSLKIQNNLLKNQLKKLRTDTAQDSATTEVLDITNMEEDDVKCRFYTGLVWLHVLALWQFLGPTKYKLSMWGCSMKNLESSPSKRKLNAMNQMFIELIRLRLGLLHQDLAYRFQISSSYISRSMLTSIQFL